MNSVLSVTTSLLAGVVLFSLLMDLFWWNGGFSPSNRRWVATGKTRFGGRRYRDNHGFTCVIRWPIDHKRN